MNIYVHTWADKMTRTTVFGWLVKAAALATREARIESFIFYLYMLVSVRDKTNV